MHPGWTPPKPKTKFRKEVGEDGWVYRINNQTDERTKTNTKVVYDGGRPLVIGINHVKRIAKANPKLNKSAKNKLIRGYKHEAWGELAAYRARMHRQDKVSKLPAGKKRAEKTKTNRPRFTRGS